MIQFYNHSLEFGSDIRMPRDPYPFPKYENDNTFIGQRQTQVRMNFLFIEVDM